MLRAPPIAAASRQDAGGLEIFRLTAVSGALSANWRQADPCDCVGALCTGWYGDTAVSNYKLPGGDRGWEATDTVWRVVRSGRRV